jgi:hypothetical protein
MKGVKAVYKKQYKYKSLWLYGIAEPLTGETFSEELPKLNREIFQSFMNRFSEKHKHCSQYYYCRQIAVSHFTEA